MTAWHILQLWMGGDSLQIWKISVKILNKKSWKADKGWFVMKY
jgi:hypothetical protein